MKSYFESIRLRRSRALSSAVVATRRARPIISEMLESRLLFTVTYTSTEVGEFTGANGMDPVGPLTLVGTNLYGTATIGGGPAADNVTYDDGVIFKIPTDGSNGPITDIYTSTSLTATPTGGLLVGNGVLYGVAQSGSITTPAGTVFSVTTDGTFNNIAQLPEDDGEMLLASGPLVQDTSGNIFGLATSGGPNSRGGVFEETNGTATDVAPMPSTEIPLGGLVTDENGNVFGMENGTSGGSDAVFEYSAGGNLTTFATFSAADGVDVNAHGFAPLIYTNGTLFGVDSAGAFKIAAGTHTITQLGTYSGLEGQPTSPLIMDSSGDLFGTTANGAFEWNSTTQAFTMIATFQNNSANGAVDGLAFGSDGDIYATVGGGGTAGDGAIYQLVPSGSSGGGGGGGGGGGTSSLTPAIAGKLPSSVIAGQKTTIKQTISITNTGSAAYDASATGNLFLSTGTTVDSSAIELPQSITKILKLKANKHVGLSFTLKSLPSTVPNGTYHLLAQVTDSSGNTSVAASAGTITIAPPQIDLSVSLPKFVATAKGGKKFTETIHVTNAGNISAKGSLSIVVYTSPDGQLDDATPLPTIGKPINLGAGKSASVPLHLVAPASGTSSFLIFQIDPNNAFNDVNLLNNIVVSPAVATFS